MSRRCAGSLHLSHGGPAFSLQGGSSRSLGMRGRQSYLKQLRVSSSSSASIPPYSWECCARVEGRPGGPSGFRWLQ